MRFFFDLFFLVKIKANQVPIKKKRGYAPKISEAHQKRIFGKFFKSLVKKNTLVPSNSQIYKELAKVLEVDYLLLYTTAKRYFAKKGIKPSNKYIEVDFDELNRDDETDNFTFEVDIRENDMLQKFLENRIYIKGLAAFLRHAIYENTHFPCNWIFDIFSDNHDRHNNISTGICKTEGCNAKVFISTTNESEKLSINITNYNRQIPHSKSYTTGKHKEKIESILKNNTPYVTRAKLANEMVIDGEHEPSVLPKRSALKLQKSRMKNKTEHYFNEDPILSLAEMKQQPGFDKCIMNIGIDPFFVLYSTPTQQALVRTQTKNSRPIFSCDATGVSIRLSKFAGISKLTGKMKRCFLYIITMQMVDGTSSPVFQMLSQNHSSIQINFMLSIFKTDVMQSRNPKEIITDDAAALILSNITTFNTMKSTHEYLSCCYDMLFEGERAPPTYIRIDRSHVVKSIMNKTGLKIGVGSDTCKFYRRFLGFIIQITDIEELKSIIGNIFILLFNRYIHNNEILQLQTTIIQTINQHKIDQITHFVHEDIHSIESIPDIEINSKNKFRKWIESVVENIRRNHVSEELNSSDDHSQRQHNILYAPALEKPIIDFLAKLPLYGNIMNNAFQSNNSKPTSSPTETDFDVLKNDLFKKETGIRVDIFVKQHIMFTQGRLVGKNVEEVRKELFDCDSEDELTSENFTLANKNLDDLNVAGSIGINSEDDFNDSTVIEDDESQIESECSSDEDSLDEKLDKFENFRGQNEDGKKAKKKIKRCHNTILEPLKQYNREVPIICNGWTSAKKNRTIVTSKTCSFDSILNFFATCYIDMQKFSEQIETAGDTFSTFIRLLFNGKDKQICDARNDILYTYYQGTNNITEINKKPKIITIDCETSFDHLFSKICQENEIFSSVTETKYCYYCKNIKQKTFKRFIPMDLTHLGLTRIENLQEYIQPAIHFSKSNCDICTSRIITKHTPGKVITFEIDLLTAQPNETGSDYLPTTAIKVSQIQNTVVYNDKVFQLKGIIERLGGGKEGGHFITHVNRNDNMWQTYDDMKTRPKTIKSDKSIKAIMIFYTNGKYCIEYILFEL